MKGFDWLPLNHQRLSIRVTVVSVFVFATLLVASIAIGLQYHFSKKMATEAAVSQYQLSASSTKDYLASLDQKAIQTTRILSKYPHLTANNWVHSDTRRLFAEIMQNNPVFYAIYIGFANGDFYELVNLETSPAVRQQLNASEQDRWVVIQVKEQKGQRQRQFDYYNDRFELRTSKSEASQYFANQRHWFKNATEDKIHKTAPYLFQHLQAPGQTYSTVLPTTGAVLAVDIALSSLSEYLGSQPLNPISRNSQTFIYQQDGYLIASSEVRSETQSLSELKPITLSDYEKAIIKQTGRLRVSNEMNWPPVDYAVSGEPRGYAIDLIRAIAQITGLQIEFVNGYSWPELLELFNNNELDLLHPVLYNPNSQLGAFSEPLLSLPYAVATRPEHAPIQSPSQLDGLSVAIPQGWSIIPVLKKLIPSVNIVEVKSTKDALESVVQGRVDAALDNEIILRQTASQFFIHGLQFHELKQPNDPFALPQTFHLVTSKQHAKLLPILNRALKSLPEDYRQKLHQKWLGDYLANDKTSVKSTQTSAVPIPEMIEWSRDPERFNRLNAFTVDGQKQYLFITPLKDDDANGEFFAAMIPEHVLLAPSLQKVIWSILLTAMALLLVMPVSWLFASPIVDPIKRLMHQAKHIQNRQYDDITPLDTNIKEIHNLSAAIIEMAHAIRQHEVDQKELMDSFVRLIAQAIDEKSPYTAAHCARVPELAILIAEAAHKSTAPPFEQFHFTSEDEWREFRLAAWLHDCGKITTPEHIVDKATKLETIYNRIHEIRTRFEVLWRDAEIDYLKQKMQTPEKEEELYKQLTDKQQKLREDFAFIAESNIGQEAMNPEHIERLHKLAQTTWLRHFDNTLGLSRAECLRMPPIAELPVEEPLLSDRLEHRIPRQRALQFEPEFGIKMSVPDDLYHLGELHNLSITYGTLSPEDRFKINEHVISTIRMLESLKFPAELSKIPRYASTHHETLNGEGYPRKLTANELTTPERILAVADIFEALTASDRPYKEAKKLSTAVEILYSKVEQQELDRNVFELFLTSGVYLEYAKRYLNPDQIDEVDINHYLT
ncbi:transporter substrate-binding domain-containing protein [Thiomicrorhabdus sp. zzn3]|uniref:HD domain-containing phosphohydrolase n=1 Tax=Thiomicrorhabdus sp. zzn3 TaxID=3039775 RepID=UPI0024368DA9|nr:HD domain-containing phosphohydrolase [Thiomicrorhabdus sp. zzn3]MDG6778535.1 transporter substrate-binding domain-containing protein [Thiomicrorhabdus sp. zzn3]